MDSILPLIYLLAAVGFILAIKWMNHPSTARRGVIIGEIGMLLAVIGTLLRAEVVEYQWVLVGTRHRLGDRRAAGVPDADDRGAAVDRAFARFRRAGFRADRHRRILQANRRTDSPWARFPLETLLGFLTTTASIIAFGKLQEILPTRPLTYKGQNVVSFIVLGGAVVLARHDDRGRVAIRGCSRRSSAFSLMFGIMLVTPIGGADMPTVIALLNSSAGVAAAAMGFVLDNRLLIIAGALNGTAG